jgi:hypothetical protein
VQTEPSPRKLAGRYELDRCVSRRPTGDVWHAIDRVLARPVAVEIAPPELAEDPNFDEGCSERARRLATVTHPNLTRLLDSGIDGGSRYLVREWVDGETLRSRLDREGPLSVGETATIGVQVLAGLHGLHEVGLLHLCLEPDAVLLAQGRTLLASPAFGPAAIEGRPREEAERLLVDVCVPPEIGSTEPPDERADVFEAGGLLFLALTGRLPSSPQAERDRDGAAASVRATRRDVPRQLDAAIRRSLAIRPEDRFASVAELADAIAPLAPEPAPERDVEPIEGTAGSRPGEARSWWRTWFAVPALVVLFAVLATLLGLWFGALEIGGPLGVRPDSGDEAPSPVAGPIEVRDVTIEDPPPGDGIENDSLLGLATDGDPATAWRSNNYYDGKLNKPGLGLLFDLGTDHVVTGFRLWTPHPGWTFQIGVGDDPSALLRPSTPTFTSTSFDRGRISPTTGRYVLLWITSVVPAGDGNRAEVGEFKPLGDDA